MQKAELNSSIALITPSFNAGGAERVMALLANSFVKRGLRVHLIILTGGDLFYNLEPSVIIHQPSFDYQKYSRLIFTWKIFNFLRTTLKSIYPRSVLSFGGRYNAFVLLSTLGLGIRVFVSDRSRPGISYGSILDLINPVVYRMTTGIIAQTKAAEVVLRNKTRHPNITVIGNPIRALDIDRESRENIVLNVGRFIGTKHQEWLVEYFAQINDPNWQLWFVGDGPQLDKVKVKALDTTARERIRFWGEQSVIDHFYAGSKIFAFTSTSEGFPNALGEAMAAGCACISYNCVAGPSDMILDNRNGFLVKVGDHVGYQHRLKTLMDSPEICRRFGEEAKRRMQAYEATSIADQFYHFICD